MTRVVVEPTQNNILIDSAGFSVSVDSQSNTVQVDNDGRISVLVQPQVSTLTVAPVTEQVVVSEANVKIVEVAQQGPAGVDADNLPPKAEVEYSYNANGLVTGIDYGDGTSKTFTYNGSDQLQQIVHVRDSDTVTYTYVYVSGQLDSVTSTVS